MRFRHCVAGNYSFVEERRLGGTASSISSCRTATLRFTARTTMTGRDTYPSTPPVIEAFAPRPAQPAAGHADIVDDVPLAFARPRGYLRLSSITGIVRPARAWYSANTGSAAHTLAKQASRSSPSVTTAVAS